MLLPFPQDLPIEGVGILIDRLRGKPIPLQTALNAAWNLVGYAATQVPIKSSESEPVQDYPITDAEVITLLEKLQGFHQVPADNAHVPVEFGIIPWAIVLKVLIKLIINVAL